MVLFQIRSYLKHFNVTDGKDVAVGTKEEAIFADVINFVPISLNSIKPVAILSS